VLLSFFTFGCAPLERAHFDLLHLMVLSTFCKPAQNSALTILQGSSELDSGMNVQQSRSVVERARFKHKNYCGGGGGRGSSGGGGKSLSSVASVLFLVLDLL